jgi:hypothetical protein
MRNISLKVVVTTRLLLVLLATLFLAGCNSSSDTTSYTTGITSTFTTASTSTGVTMTTGIVDDLPYRTYSSLTLSAAPKLGEIADLTFTVDIIKLDASHPSEGLAKSKAWIDFYWTNTEGSYSEAYRPVQIPLEEIFVDGDLTWEGSYNKGFTLQGKIKLPREGIWSIFARFYGEGWNSGGFGAELEVAVADGTAAIIDTEEFKNGPLAYMGNATYADGVGGYQKGVSPPVSAYEGIPVTLGLDISKAPRAGEEVTLSCRITSIIDVPDVSIQWHFLRRLGDSVQDIPATELLSSADLGWKTDVKKGEPAVFSTTIKFPTEGDWEIAASGVSGTKPLIQSGHRMRISITSTRSSFGWKDIIRPSTGKPPSTTPRTTTAIFSTTTQH